MATGKRAKTVSNPLNKNLHTNTLTPGPAARKTFVEKIKQKIADFKEFWAELKEINRNIKRHRSVYVKFGDEWVREHDIPNIAKGEYDEYLIRRPFRKDKIIDAKTYFECNW